MNYQEYLETWVELYIRGEINSRKVPLTEKEYNEKYAEQTGRTSFARKS